MRWLLAILTCTLAMSTLSTAAQSVAPPTTDSPCKEYADVIAAQDAAVKAADEEIAALRAAIKAKDSQIAELHQTIDLLRGTAETYRQMWADSEKFKAAQEKKARWANFFQNLRVGMYGAVAGYALNEAVR